MSIPTVVINESTPAGSNSVNSGDDRVREFKTQNREILEVDHEYPSSGQSATAGQHKQVTLQESADIGSGASGVPIFGAQTDSAGSGKPEACFTDEDDNDVFITDDGKVGNRNVPVVGSTINAVSGLYINGVNIMGLIYPVGSYYFNDSVSTNPATLLGVGTWAALEGRVLVGKASSGTFDTAGEELGAETITLTSAQSGLPAHTHNYTRTNTSPSSGSESGGDGDQTMTTQATAANTAANASEAHSNLQPSRTVYIWRRVS